MAQLTDWEQDTFAEFLEDVDEETQELLETARLLWLTDQNMLITCVVSAPYDGCFYEPNIHLVDVVDAHENSTELVLPLYASGQGLGTDIIQNFGELCQWIVEESLMGIYAKDDRVSPRCSQHHMLSPHGKFDSFDVKPATTIVNDLNPAEHYWAHAVRVADDQWGIELKWRCEKCEQVITGGQYECEPVFTGYRGNGGVGVFMEGAICQECADQGMCQICREHVGHSEGYDPDVAEHGWHICEWHVEDCFKGTVKATEEDIDLPETVMLRKHGSRDQHHLPGFEPKTPADGRLVFVDEKDLILPVVVTDRDKLVEALRYQGMCDVEWFLDNTEFGLALPGRGVELAIEKS